MRFKTILTIAVMFAFASIGAVSAHTAGEIDTFAECKAAGGEVTSIELLIYPSQTQTRCAINGHIFTEGSDEITHVAPKGEFDQDGPVGFDQDGNSLGGSSSGSVSQGRIDPRADGSVSADVVGSNVNTQQGTESPNEPPKDMDGDYQGPSEGTLPGSSAGNMGLDTAVQTQAGVNTDILKTLRERRESPEIGLGAGMTSEERVQANEEARASFLQTLEARREEAQEQKQELRQNRSQAQISLEAGATARVEALANGLFESLERALERLRDIAERIENKIAQLEEDGNDLSAESEMLSEARLTLEVAETEILEAETSLEAMISAESPREAFGTFRTAVGEAREALRAAKQELMEVVNSIKLSLSSSVEAEAEVETEAEVE